MITRNGKMYFTASALSPNIPIQTLGIVNAQGAQVECSKDGENAYFGNVSVESMMTELWVANYNHNNSANSSVSAYCHGTLLGTGATPPTEDDYWLAGDVITGFSHTTQTIKGVDENGAYYQCVYTITNTGTEDISIGEIISYTQALGKNASGKKLYNSCLINRDVFTEPIVIPAGGVGQVTYTIRSDFPQ